jgi:hypothetical protein
LSATPNMAHQQAQPQAKTVQIRFENGRSSTLVWMPSKCSFSKAKVDICRGSV